MHETEIASILCIHEYELSMVDSHGTKVVSQFSVEVLKSRSVTACLSSFKLNMTSKFI